MDTKKLRQKILDLAIRGKLVPQDPNDEPASVLLERIRAEKERLIKEGKIKRSKKSASDTPHYENETPFEIPKSWEWIRLSDIAYFGGGKTPSMDEKRYWQNGRNLWVTSKDMKFDRISDSLMKITDDALAIMTQYDPGTLLMVTRSGILRHSLPIALLEKKATVNQDLKTISFYKGDIAEYIFYAIKANEQFILKEYHKDGTTVDSINFEKFANILLPLPPQNEQLRIIKALHDWFGVAESIEIDKELLHSVIDGTKSKILDLAIHGKLVSQNPDDEPAIELLKRINPKFTPCDNAHYENVPSNWAVCKVKDVFRINPKTKADDGMEAGFVPMSNIQDSYNNNFSYELRTWGNIKKGYTHFEDGDIVVAKLSPCLENRKSAVIVGLPNGIGAGTTELNVFRSDYVYPLYGLFFFKSDYFISQCVGTFNGVVGQQRVSTKIIEDMVFPVPPRPEQERIINKVNELFQILDNISAEL